ncbi:uncharacterized protein LOC143279665 [Babylonia areolata]|uniref:uncharacterized protein LOC143279665 n=1 Tax=Babylonia areolata TaxID=304850 RepID=UPI003FD4BB20
MDMDTLWSSALLLLLQCVCAASRCSFPSEWWGTWYQNGLGEIRITKHSVSHKGRCISSDGKKYLVSDRKCFTCLVFTPQHENLLQYKESFCDNDDNIDKVCGTITGDFQLHTIVKVSGNPIPCPFQGPYTFSYTNESVESCKDPPSEIHACADKSKFIFRYKRCKRMPHTQDIELSFQCMAMWFNGEYFLYGKFSSTGRQVIKKMYRCFMYILYGTRGDMSMSQDATCQGLSSPRFGMNTFELIHRVDQWPRPSCVFPNFLWRSGAWRDVGGEWRMTVEANNEELAIHTLIHPDFLTPGEKTPETQLRARCLDQVLDEATPMSPALREVHVLTYATNHSCESSYRCVRLKQRADQVFEMRIGDATDDTYLACQDAFFTNSETRIFFPHEKETVPCPMNGSYTYQHSDGLCQGSLEIGCEKQGQMLIHASCPSRKHSAEILKCYRTWREGTRQYAIAGRPGNLYTPVGCLMFEEKGQEQRLTEVDCGPRAGISVMNQDIDYSITSDREDCSTRQPDAPYFPQGPDGRTRSPRVRWNPGVTSTSRPGGGRGGEGEKDRTDLTTKVRVINNSNPRTCASCIVCLCALLTVLLNER